MTADQARKRRLRRSDDPRGYWLDEEFREGFPDDLALVKGQRLRIAGWARALTPGDLTEAQHQLLGIKDGQPSPSLERAEELSSYRGGPLWSALSRGQQALVDVPSEHPELQGTTYPLGVAELATLVGASRDKVHHWHDSGLLPARRSPGGHRRFYAAAAVRAFLLVGLRQPEITILKDLRNGTAGPLLVGMSEVLRTRFEAADGDERDLLERTATDLEQLGTAFVEARSMEELT
jgi:excisionase family DNA binding protein